MKPLYSLLIPLLTIACAATPARADAVPTAVARAAESARQRSASAKLVPETILQLEAVRQAASRFFNIQTAFDEGYVDIEVDIPHMGHHPALTGVDSC